jgi:hypothetical protein
MDFAAACLRRRGRASKVITGFDRHSVRFVTRKIRLRGPPPRPGRHRGLRRVGGRPCRRSRTGPATAKRRWEWRFAPDQNDPRAEVELFRQLQRFRSPGVVETDRAKALDRCRQAAGAIRKSEVYPARKMSAYERDLWKRAAEKIPGGKPYAGTAGKARAQDCQHGPRA